MKRLVFALLCVLLALCVRDGVAQSSATTSGLPHALLHDHLLRVCADPNNLPFSNRKGQGFENRLAQLLAAEWGAHVQYTWWAQRRGFLRNTLNAGACDVVVGVPLGLERVRATAPYYRSRYVFVTRADRSLSLHSLDDPRLSQLRVGVHVIGDDYANTPPAHALARRGVIDNVTGFSIYGDYAQPNPPSVLLDAVDAGQLDVGIAWGPLAGYFAQHGSHDAGSRLVLSKIEEDVDAGLPMVFDIAMGVRPRDEALQRRLDQFLSKRSREVQHVLDEFSVPREPPQGGVP